MVTKARVEQILKSDLLNENWEIYFFYKDLRLVLNIGILMEVTELSAVAKIWCVYSYQKAVYSDERFRHVLSLLNDNQLIDLQNL